MGAAFGLGLGATPPWRSVDARPIAALKRVARTELGLHGSFQHTDGWDEQLILLMDLICRFLGCPGNEELMSTRVEAVASAFVAMPRPIVVPVEADGNAIQTALAEVGQARYINGSFPVLPEPLARQLEDVLFEISIALEDSLDD